MAIEGFVPGLHTIDSYRDGGFRFAAMSHRGSILALPSGIAAWAPSDLADVDPGALIPLLDEAAAIEHLLFGTGLDIRPLPARIRDPLRAAGLRVEPMSTGAAVRTYNILIAEGRRVGAALLAVP